MAVESEARRVRLRNSLHQELGHVSAASELCSALHHGPGEGEGVREREGVGKGNGPGKGEERWRVARELPIHSGRAGGGLAGAMSSSVGESNDARRAWLLDKRAPVRLSLAVPSPDVSARGSWVLGLCAFSPAACWLSAAFTLGAAVSGSPASAQGFGTVLV